MAGVVTSAQAQPIVLDLTFKLTDLEYHPLQNVPVRLVFGSDPDWQGAGAGKRVVTDAKGEAHFTASVTLDQKLRKVPTNFVGSLVSGPQQTDHLTVAAELEFADFHWLYVADLFRFREGDTMTDGLSVYTPDERGGREIQIYAPSGLFNSSNKKIFPEIESASAACERPSAGSSSRPAVRDRA